MKTEVCRRDENGDRYRALMARAKNTGTWAEVTL